MECFNQLAAASEVIDFDKVIADTASDAYRNLRARGLMVVSINKSIGATAVCYDYTLITANVKHFQNRATAPRTALPMHSSKSVFLSLISF